MSAQERLDAALDALASGDYNRAFVLAREVQKARFFDRRLRAHADARQADDAFRLEGWAWDAARAAS